MNELIQILLVYDLSAENEYIILHLLLTHYSYGKQICTYIYLIFNKKNYLVLFVNKIIF